MSYNKNRNPNPKTKETWKNNAQRQRENGYRKEWERNNPDKLKEHSLYRHLHKTHNITQSEWESCLKYFNYECAYCGMTLEEHLKKYKERLHKEHVDPEGENRLNNCVPGCKACNCSKHTSLLDDWYNKNNSSFTQERYNRIIQWITEEYKKYIQPIKPKRKYNRKNS